MDLHAHPESSMSSATIESHLEIGSSSRTPMHAGAEVSGDDQSSRRRAEGSAVCVCIFSVSMIEYASGLNIVRVASGTGRGRPGETWGRPESQ